MARVLPVAMIVATVGMSVLYLSSTGQRNPMFLFLPMMMLMSVIGTLVHGARGAGRIAEINAQRADYLRYLDALDGALAAAAAEQHDWLHRHHPDPAALWTLAGSDRMWARTADHPEFGAVRVGVGERAGGHHRRRTRDSPPTAAPIR